VIEARFRRVNLCKFIRHHRMVANRGGLSNCSRVELNCGVGYFAVPAFASWGMIIIFEELRGLVLKTSGLVDILRAALAPLAAQID